MQCKYLIYKAVEHDIHFNLATEAFLMEKLQSGTNALFLWRNAPTVVIGRYQNPFIECNLGNMDRDGVKLARRFSGGGAVYHDLGNLCFTFIRPKDQFSKERNFSIVAKALKSLGLHTEVSGRNDILANGAKISGNAFQITTDRVCHHGTLLFDCALDVLPFYLTPDIIKLESHGVKSVASRVKNIRDLNDSISIQDIENALIREFKEDCHADCQTMDLEKENLIRDPYIQEVYSRLSSKQWNLGMTPRFKDLLKGRNNFGSFSFQLDVDRAVIKKASVYTDSLQTTEVETLMSRLVGLPYDGNALRLESEKEKDLFLKEALMLLSDLIVAGQNSK